MIDIKDENVVIDERARIQLIDFGSATYYGDGIQFVTFCGTLDYCSPEVLKGHRYDGPQQEVWALGVLLYTLVYKENPYYSIDEILDRELRIPFVMSKDSLHLIQWMLTRKVSARPTIDQILSHPFLA